ASEANPNVVILNERISALRNNIIESLNSSLSSLRITRRDLQAQESLYGGRVSEVPTHERQYKVIARQQQIKEQLFLYLLQKREETAISMAVTSPKAKVIDPAYPNGSVAPNRRMIYMFALIVGLALPIWSSSSSTSWITKSIAGRMSRKTLRFHFWDRLHFPTT